MHMHTRMPICIHLCMHIPCTGRRGESMHMPTRMPTCIHMCLRTYRVRGAEERAGGRRQCRRDEEGGGAAAAAAPHAHGEAAEKVYIYMCVG